MFMIRRRTCGVHFGRAFYAGFSIERVDIFDNRHGTFKQVRPSAMPPGCDLLLHCLKGETARASIWMCSWYRTEESVRLFLEGRRENVQGFPISTCSARGY